MPSGLGQATGYTCREEEVRPPVEGSRSTRMKEPRPAPVCHPQSRRSKSAMRSSHVGRELTGRAEAEAPPPHASLSLLDLKFVGV
jgi:hypothetical protein